MSGRVIGAKEVLRDIKAGFGDLALMEKYKLSSKGLDDLYVQLTRAGLLQNRGMVRRQRRCSRHHVNFVLPVYDEHEPECVGEVLDISEDGLRVGELEARVNEKKILVVSVDELFGMGHLRFYAICRWTSRDRSDGKQIAGFELAKMPGNNLPKLPRLIQLMDIINDLESDEFDESLELTDRRSLVRYGCSFQIPIHDAIRRENRGTILNITEDGFAVEGMSCEQGDEITMVIPAYHHRGRHFNSIVIIAECRWASLKESGGCLCGFKVTERKARNYKELQRLAQTVADAQHDRQEPQIETRGTTEVWTYLDP